MFAWALEMLALRGLIVGKRVAIDTHTLKINIHGIEELVADKGYLTGAALGG